MKLKWAWVPFRDLDGNVHHEKELQYSVDGGRTWFPVGSDPKPQPEKAAPPPDPIAIVGAGVRATRKRGLGPLGGKILDEVSAKPARARAQRQPPTKPRSKR